MDEIVLITSHNPNHGAEMCILASKCVCVPGGGGESLLNSLEANEEGNSGKEKKRCNP